MSLNNFFQTYWKTFPKSTLPMNEVHCISTKRHLKIACIDAEPCTQNGVLFVTGLVHCVYHFKLPDIIHICFAEDWYFAMFQTGSLHNQFNLPLQMVMLWSDVLF